MSNQRSGNYASALHTLSASQSQPSLGASNGAGSLRRTAQINTQVKLFAQPRATVKGHHSSMRRGGGGGAGGALNDSYGAAASTNGLSDSKRPVALRSTSQSLSASRGAAAAFNISSVTGVPKHLETYGHVAIAATARQSTAPLNSKRPEFGATASSAASAGTEGLESVGGNARPRAKSSNPFSASSGARASTASGPNRYCPVGSRPRFTFTGPPKHLKPSMSDSHRVML